MKALRTGLLVALFALGLSVGAASAEPLPQLASQASSVVDGAMDMPEVDMPAMSETKIDVAAAGASNGELDDSTGRGGPSEADAGMIAKLLMLSAMAGASPMASAAFGLQ